MQWVFLQHLPDFKGIETPEFGRLIGAPTCSTSLTSKGLRHHASNGSCSGYCLQHLPDFKGIETVLAQAALTEYLQHLPDFKGIETMLVSYYEGLFACSTSLTSKGLRHVCRIKYFHWTTCSTSLTSKGLRRWLWFISCRKCLQHLPDFKGIETQSCH